MKKDSQPKLMITFNSMWRGVNVIFIDVKKTE